MTAHPHKTCPACGRPLELAPIVLKAVLEGATEIKAVRTAVRKQMPAATDKQIFNALGGLTIRGKIRTVGYGQYRPPLDDEAAA